VTLTALQTLQCERASGLTLHLALRVHNDASVVLKVQEYAVLAAPRLPLADDHRWHDCTATAQGSQRPQGTNKEAQQPGYPEGTGNAQPCWMQGLHPYRGVIESQQG
jgi:hypothetical protein